MRRLSNAFKNRVSTGKNDQSVLSTGGEFPSAVDLIRYRKQRGVNLGSWFVLERWITDAPFQHAKAPAQSDLDVALGKNAKEVLEHHWDTWITEKDFAWIAERGLNSVRLPIGYYHICGADPSVLEGTDFADLKTVYHGAWQRITNAVAMANRYGLGVLIDLHAAPGKQNGDAHAGTSGELRFFDKSNMAHTIHVLSSLLTHLTRFCSSQDPPLTNVLGIEPLNEPVLNSSLEKWYIHAIHVLRQIARIPVYIGDSWATDQWARYIHNHTSEIPFTVLDHHLYRCFTQPDGNTTVIQHVKNLTDSAAETPQLFARVTQKLEEAGSALIVGEWSGALNPGSLVGVEDEIRARKDFVTAQLALYEKFAAGYYFWTYKKQHPGDKGWSLRDAVECGVFPSRVGLEASVVKDDTERELRKNKARDMALQEHSNYWAQYPGKYEHSRFTDGFCQGWDDAWLFYRSINTLPKACTVPELGFRGPWVKARVHDYEKEKGNKSIWEFEHGFVQGLLAAQKDLS